jgi:hypothetical protein
MSDNASTSAAAAAHLNTVRAATLLLMDAAGSKLMA